LDHALSADQELFVETTRRFLEATTPLQEVRRLHAEVPEGFDRKVWRQAAELGWTAMLVPEADGGGSVSGHGVLDVVLVAEELGRLVGPGPLLPVNVVADAVARRGTEAQRRAILPGLLSGEAVATWAFAEPAGTWDASGVEAAAVRDGGHFVLTGTKSFVQDAGVADVFLVTARTGGGLTQFVVPAGAPGLRVTPLGSLDLTRRFGTVHLDGVRLDLDAVLGEVDGAAADVERQLQVALVIQAAETVGAIGRVFDMTLEYAQDRVAFGRPLASYQALKHRFADLRTWLEACRATAVAAARAVDEEAPDAAELVSVAKAYIADRSPAVVQDCVQLHGGIGVTWEHDLHLYLRRVTQNAVLYGSVRQHQERLATFIGMAG